MNLDLSFGETFNCLAWVLHNNFVNENGFSLEIKNHSFLVEPFMDETPQQVIMKAAQVGWSTLAILRSLHLAHYNKANVIYTLPSKSIVKDFVIPKVDPLISNNTKIKALITGADSTGLKAIGDRFVYFRSSWDEASGIAISADILISDEVDRSNQLALRTYRSRLDAARLNRPDLGWEWKFSNPSIPGDGVDVWWQKSDQKHWFITCSACLFKQFMSYPESIDFERKEYVCKRCSKILSPIDRQKGEWVKRRLGATISGYWLNQLMLPWIPASKIIEESKGDQSVFYNFTLGLPYIAKDSSISRVDIVKCVVDYENPRVDVAIGVDVGKVKHFVIGNRYGIFRIGTTTDWQVIEDLRNQYNAYMVIDAMPNPDEPAKLAQKYRGKVFINYFKEDSKQLGAIQWGELDKYGVVYSDRVKIIDALMADIQNQDVAFNYLEHDSHMQEYISHWMNMFRVIQNQVNRDGANTGSQKPAWLTIEGKPDHYVFAHLYQKIAQLKTLSTGAIINTAKKPEQQHAITIQNNQATVPGISSDEILKGIKGNKQYRGWKTL